MAENSKPGAAARRAAHALVHSLGATGVHLQTPALPVADDDGEELGLRSPDFQLQEFAPAAVRRQGDATVVLVPADVVEAGLGVQGAGAVKAALPAGSVFQIDDELHVLSGVQPVTAGGCECLYRLSVQKPATEVV